MGWIIQLYGYMDFIYCLIIHFSLSRMTVHCLLLGIYWILTPHAKLCLYRSNNSNSNRVDSDSLKQNCLLYSWINWIDQCLMSRVFQFNFLIVLISWVANRRANVRANIRTKDQQAIKLRMGISFWLFGWTQST